MDELQRLYEHQTMMAIGIYSFLDNLLSHLPSTSTTTSTPSPSSTHNDNENSPRSLLQEHTLNTTNGIIRETSTITDDYASNIMYDLNVLTAGDTFNERNERIRTTLTPSRTLITWPLSDLSIPSINSSQLHPVIQNSVNTTNNIENNLSDNIDSMCTQDSASLLKDIQPGGYLEEIFIYLSNSEKEEYLCTICYLILKEAYQCQNQHKFCYGCIYTWSTGPTAGHDSCPVCRCDGLYAKNFELNDRINKKRVRCPQSHCNWMGMLSAYHEHEHRRYSPYELDLLLADCKKDNIKSLTSLLPLSTQNQIGYNEKELSIKVNDSLQINETSETNNQHYRNTDNQSNQRYLDPGRVPNVCEPINQITEQINENSVERLLTTQRRIRPLRNDSRHRLQSSMRIQNRQPSHSRNCLNQTEDSGEGVRRHTLGNNNHLSSSQGSNNQVHSQALHRGHHHHPQQQQQTSTSGQRQLRSHETPSTPMHRSNSHTRLRPTPIIRDTRNRAERLPNVRRLRRSTCDDNTGQQRPDSSQSTECRSENSQSSSRLDFTPNNNNTGSQNIEASLLIDRTEMNRNEQNINISRLSQVNLPAINSSETIPANSNTHQGISNNNTQSSFQNINSFNSIPRIRQPLEFRRLVPRRQRRVVEQLRETREQLAAMLHLMTMELEERQNRILNTDLEIGNRNRLLRSQNNLFPYNDNNSNNNQNMYSEDTTNDEFLGVNNQNTSSRHVHSPSARENDNQSNYYTNQLRNISTPTSTMNNNNNNSSNNNRDVSRTLLTPTYRVQTTTTTGGTHTEQMNTNNNNRYDTIPTTTTVNNAHQSSASSLTSTSRLLTRLRINTLAQTRTPSSLFTPHNRSIYLVNENNERQISIRTRTTTSSSFMTGDSSNDEDEQDSDDESSC
ncbi:unnamed protein product [Trichobilharzia szidati]|nr:unnamed protein product [Trichobilharzia szidati]